MKITFLLSCLFFFFNDTATTEIYTLSLHDALPIFEGRGLRRTFKGGIEAVRDIDLRVAAGEVFGFLGPNGAGKTTTVDRKSTRLNSSHANISYAVFCLKKKKKRETMC